MFNQSIKRFTENEDIFTELSLTGSLNAFFNPFYGKYVFHSLLKYYFFILLFYLFFFFFLHDEIIQISLTCYAKCDSNMKLSNMKPQLNFFFRK